MIPKLSPSYYKIDLKINKKNESISHPVVSVSVTPWTVAHQAPLSMGFSRQEYWSESSFPPPGEFSDAGIEPGSPALQVDSLPSKLTGKPLKEDRYIKMFQKMIEWTSQSVI